ncbi:MAG: cysteine hydrolase family protein [Methanomassiliicoccales archaeon]
MGRAVIVIDMIHDFVYGKLGGERAQATVPCVSSLLRYARENEIPVVFLKDAHREGDKEMQVWGEHAMKGTEGSAIIEELSPQEDEYVMEKHTYSAFFDTGLHELLSNLDVDELILSGVTTDICIRHSAADAFFRGYDVVVPKDCVNSVSEEVHERALEEMENLYKAEIVELDRVIG